MKVHKVGLQDGLGSVFKGMAETETSGRREQRTVFVACLHDADIAGQVDGN